MNYWTTFYVGGSECASTARHGEYSGRQRYTDIFLTGRASDLNAKGMAAMVESGTVHEEDEPVMFALVNPTEEELMALGNAVVYDPTRCRKEEQEANEDRKYKTRMTGADSVVRLALRPQDYDGFCVAFRKNTAKAQYGWRGEAEAGEKRYKNSDLTLIRDGQIVDDFCSDCPKVLGRAAGKCEPPLRGCGHSFFSPEARITRPPAGQYLTHSQCMPYTAFHIFTPSDLDVTVTAEAPLKQDNNSSASKAGATRSMRTTLCKQCTMSYHNGKSYRCFGGWINPSMTRCPGPIFDSELPMPSTLTRQLLRFKGRYVDWEVLRAAVNDGLFVQPDSSIAAPVCLPNWRKDPEVIVGWHNKINKTVRFHAQRIMKPHWCAEMPLDDFYHFIDKYNYNLPEVPEECTPTERLVCYGIERGIVLSEYNRNHGFGKVATTYFTHADYEGGDDYRFNFQFVSFHEDRLVSSVGEMGYLFPRLVDHLGRLQCDYDEECSSLLARKTKLMKAYTEGGKKERAALKKYMVKARLCGSMGGPIPVPEPAPEPLAHT